MIDYYMEQNNTLTKLYIAEMAYSVEGKINKHKATFKTKEVTIIISPLELDLYGLYDAIANRVYQLYLEGKITQQSKTWKHTKHIRIA